MIDKLLLATHNKGKVKEFQKKLAILNIPIVYATELDIPEPEETGVTFAENALLKARFCCQASGLVALADDSGLCVEALGGDPGVYSARWASVDAEGNRDFKTAFRAIEEKLPSRENVRATMVCTLAVAWPDGRSSVVEARMPGALVFPPRGTLNFGYDPIFLPDGYDKTFAEMDPEFKNKISHRAQAFEKILPVLMAPE